MSQSDTNDNSVYIADWIWLGGDRLVAGATVEVSDGLITEIAPSKTRTDAKRLHGVVLPGLVNAHSHAFHRLLRGRTHRQGGDFWLWRDRMYEIAGSLTPETYERLATALFVEMALSGVTAVGEFHYLHHQTGGTPYRDPNEMGHALVRAARRAGIKICLLDAGYFRAGFEDRPLHPVQTRFSDVSAEQWLNRVETLAAGYRDADDVVVGVAPHSVRAVSESGLSAVSGWRPPGMPLHIHVSEQPAENEACLEATGLTPVGLLERSGVLGTESTLVHATHLGKDDVDTVGVSGSSVCYCATTERDLADGIGPISGLSQAGATVCIGSDSHAVVDLFEETRGIETHSRLASGRRGVFAPRDLLAAATVNGAASLGFPRTGLAVGSPADFVVIDPDSPRLAGMGGETALDTIVFAASASDVIDVFVRGRPVVTGGDHPLWDEAAETFELFSVGLSSSKGRK